MSNGDEKWIGIALVVIGALILFSILSYFFMPFLFFTEERQAGEEVVEDTYNAENAVQHYEEFRDMYHDIQAQREQVNNAYDEEEQFHETYGDDPNEWSREAEIRHGRIHERITGNQNQLEQLVADYNAKSDKANQELFKCSLPYEVDDRFAIRGPPGSGSPEEPQDVGPDGEPISGSPPPAEECDGLPDKVEA